MLRVLLARLHRDEHEIGVEPVDHVVGGVGEERVIVLLVEVGRRRPRLAHGHADQPALLVEPLALERVWRKRLRLEEERGIGGDLDVGCTPTSSSTWRARRSLTVTAAAPLEPVLDEARERRASWSGPALTA